MFFGDVLGVVFGFFPVVMGGIWCLTFKGGGFDPENKKTKKVVSFLGIRFGFWKSIQEYSCICLLRHNNREDMESPVPNPRFFPVPLTQYFFNFYTYEICFLTSDHRKKTPFVSFTKKEKAEEIIELLSKKLRIKVVVYNPT